MRFPFGSRRPFGESRHRDRAWLGRVLPRLGVAGCLAIALTCGSASFARAELLQATAIAPREPSSLRSSVDPDAPTRRELIDILAAADAVYLGELHDRAYDHRAQLEILRELHARSPNIAIAMEMFYRPFQGAIDAYLAGDIDEAELVERTEYETRWGYPWELYAPILRFARDRGIPVIAANVPIEITRQVAAGGLDSLGPNDLQYAPPIDEIDLSDADYRAALYDIFQMHARMGAGHAATGGEESGAEESESEESESGEPEHGNDDGFDRFFAAQVLWDETIAESIAIALRDDPDRQVIAILGRGHVAYDFGVPSRVRRRLAERSELPDFADLSNFSDFTDVSVFFATDAAEITEIIERPPTPELENRRPVDYFWSFEPASP